MIKLLDDILSLPGIVIRLNKELKQKEYESIVLSHEVLRLSKELQNMETRLASVTLRYETEVGSKMQDAILDWSQNVDKPLIEKARVMLLSLKQDIIHDVDEYNYLIDSSSRCGDGACSMLKYEGMKIATDTIKGYIIEHFDKVLQSFREKIIKRRW